MISQPEEKPLSGYRGVARLAGRLSVLWQGRRRLAVSDENGMLPGLLCLKRSGPGFCSDSGIQAGRRPGQCSRDS